MAGKLEVGGAAIAKGKKNKYVLKDGYVQHLSLHAISSLPNSLNVPDDEY